MNAESVVFKWQNGTLIILVKQKIEFQEDVMKNLKEKLESYRSFFKNSSDAFNIKLSFEGDSLDNELKNKIKTFLENETKIDIEIVDEKSEKIVYNDPSVDSEFESSEGHAKIYKGTVRSGQHITSHENLVILGDVNPGSQISAVCDVYVFGALRGIVHAGLTGNKSSVVVALKLQPTQLRIANIITRPPDVDNISEYPEIAFIQNGQIFIKYYFKSKNNF